MSAPLPPTNASPPRPIRPSAPTDPAGILAEADAALAEVSGSLRGTTAARERDRILLHDAVRTLADGGFGALRIPASLGGAGLDLEGVFRRLVDLATVDSNLAHVFRGHIGLVESLHAIGLDGEGHGRRWARRVAAERILVGNAQSERRATADLGTRLTADGDGLRLDGVKYYTTGSLYADWIQLTALQEDEPRTVLVDARQPGVTSVDDWDGFGQVLTGSGTTRFEGARVDPADVRGRTRQTGDDSYVAAVFQLVLLAVHAGIAAAAHADAVAFVRGKRRVFGFAGETIARDQELVQVVIGRVGAQAHAARALVLAGARDLDAALARADAGPAEDRADALRDALLDVFRLQQVVPRLVLDATTELFEVGGASAVASGLGLDRHWRNARTVFSHNPALQRERAIGEFDLNGTFTPWHDERPATETEDPR